MRESVTEKIKMIGESASLFPFFKSRQEPKQTSELENPFVQLSKELVDTAVNQGMFVKILERVLLQAQDVRPSGFALAYLGGTLSVDDPFPGMTAVAFNVDGGGFILFHNYQSNTAPAHEIKFKVIHPKTRYLVCKVYLEVKNENCSGWEEATKVVEEFENGPSK